MKLTGKDVRLAIAPTSNWEAVPDVMKIGYEQAAIRLNEQFQQEDAGTTQLAKQTYQDVVNLVEAHKELKQTSHQTILGLRALVQDLLKWGDDAVSLESASHYHVHEEIRNELVNRANELGATV